MANLTRRWSWKKWAPDLGENRENIDAWKKGGSQGPSPGLYLELATGLTGRQMTELGAALGKAREVVYVKPQLAEGAPTEDVIAAYEAATKAYFAAIRAVFVEAMGPYVRVHAGPHTVDGEQLATLNDYLAIAEGALDRGVNARNDLELALVRFNSIEGPDELFSPRLSGGARSTDAQRTEPAAPKTASP